MALANDGCARTPWTASPAASTPERTLRRIEAVVACREALDRNVAPLLAVEAMTMALRAG